MRKLKLLLALCMVTIAASASKTVYLAPGTWDVAEATEYYAIWAWAGSDPGQWYVMDDTDNDGIYEYTFTDDNLTGMQFGRMGANTLTSATDYNTAEKWNTTGDLTITDGILYTISGEVGSPTVTTSIYGATAASFTDGGKYIFKNVGTNRYLGPANDWGTQASLIPGSITTIIHANNGKYRIESQVWNHNSNDWVYFNGGYMDSNAPQDVTISKLSNGAYVLSNGTTYYGHNGSSTFILNGELTDFNNANAQWQIVSCDDAIANATADNPVDASFLISNPNFDRNHRLGTGAWTNPSNLGLAGGDKTNFCVEAYEKTFDLSQTITVPNGYYKVRAQAAVTMHTNRVWDTYDATKCPVVYATSGSATVTTPFKEMVDDDKLTSQTQIGNAFLAGNYVTEYSDMLTVTNKTITIGAKSEYTNIWGVFDTFMLQYCGPLDLSGYATSLANAVSAAEALNGTIPTACYDAIAAVVAEKNKTYDNEDDYQAAIDAIGDAISTYASDNIVAAYARYNRIKAAVLAINASTDVTAFDEAANAATTNTAIDAVVPGLRNALTTYLADGLTNVEIDVTDALIDNPEPGISGNLDWWTTNQTTGYGNNLYEFYKKDDASSRQTIPATMPVGYYKMTVVGYTRSEYTACMFVDVNNSNVANQTLVGVASGTVNKLSEGNSWIAAGNGVNEMIFNLENAAENNLTIGIWAGDQGDKWTCWRSFKLEYLGTAPLVIFQQELAAAAEAANTHATELGETIPAGAKTAYTNAISTAAAKNTTIDECLQSKADIEAATAAADACVAPYAAYNTLNTAVQALYDVAKYEELTTGAHETLGTAISTAATTVTEATTAATIEDVTSTLKAAGVTYAGAANPTGTAQFDLTFMLNNPDVTKYWNGTWWIVPDGWHSEQADGNKQVMKNDATTNGEYGVYFEYWSNPAKTNGLFNLYTSVTLAKGTYNMSCYAFAKDEGNPATNGAGVYFYANDTQGSQVTSNKLTEQSIVFVNDAEQEVKIGLKPTSGNTYNWMGIGYVKLYKVPAQSYTVDETVAWDNTVSGAGDVTLNRTIKAGVNTLVLPFSMTQAVVEDNFGEDSEVYVLSSYDAAKENLSFTIHDGISANLPCLLKATKEGTSYNLKDRTIVAGTPEITVTGAKMTGTYAATMNAPEGSFIISGGKIYNVNSTVALKNTRAYITLTTDGARALTFSLDGGETTGIATMENGEMKMETGVIYDLQGRRVVAPAKGLYIINGKKVVK
jgi:hypothetical protein